MDKNINKKKGGNGILYCYMFNENRGSYATIGNNIVHEIINCFKSDDGKHFLYIPPEGKLKTDGISYVLIAEAFGTHKVRVRYKISVKELPEEYVIAEKFGSNISYGNRTLEYIFRNNSENNDYYANFICENEWKPKGEIIIYDNDCDEAKNQLYTIKKVKPESMFIYLDGNDIKRKTDYKAIFDIIEDKGLWEYAHDDFKQVDAVEKELRDREYKETTFINIIGKENDELAFSNMFAYFFSANERLFKEFAKEILDVELNDKISIKREYKHIDIYINDGTTHIIIENKIKSGINGIKDDNTSQLNKYIDSIINDDNLKNKNKQDIANSIKCLIFRPEYVDLGRYSKYLKCVYNKDNVKKEFEYTQISYKEIYNFYNEKQQELKLDNNDAIFFKLFLEAMEKHTRPIDTDIEDRMKARFIKRIKELPNQTE